MLPLVSVIIPLYNHSQYIVEALDSIKNDTYSNKEIVIIDDGSKDNSKDLIYEWIVKNPEQEIDFLSRTNKGLCATLNELVKKSSGKYIVILASDDSLCNNTLASRVEILENNKDKLVLVADAKGIDSSGYTIHNSIMSDFHKVDKARYESELGLLDEVIFRFAISGAVVMANKEIYKLIGEYPEDLKAEDLFFYLRSACLKKIIFADMIVSNYRIHDSNTSGVNPELTNTVIKTLLRNLKYVPGTSRKLKVIKRVIGLYFYKIFARD